MLYSQKLSQNSYSKKESITSFNIMIVGATGSGKTSFIRTFCEFLKQDIIQGTYKETGNKALKNSLQSTEEIYTTSMHIEENGKRTALTFIDTPGISSPVIQQLQSLTSYIDSQYFRTLAEESKLQRDAKAVDTHVHACLYFIVGAGFQGLSEVDKFILKVLSSRVNVIPILSKADTLTSAQHQWLKETIKEEIFNIYRIPVYGHIQVEDSEEGEYSKDGKDDENDIKDTNFDKKDEAHLSKIINMLQDCMFKDMDEDACAMLEYLHTMPFSMISYEENFETGRPIEIRSHEINGCQTSAESLQENYNDSVAKIINSSEKTQTMINHNQALGRRYPWSVVECCNPDHCDFLLLKRMLLSTHRDMLKIDTSECFYENYRTQQLISHQKDKASTMNSQLKKANLS
ncbi:hypothetical protein G6F43_002142 [Rhizopus delemar]|nr:hypothetical protein G6F43_002142 [Rhizopus delemar]